MEIHSHPRELRAKVRAWPSGGGAGMRLLRWIIIVGALLGLLLPAHAQVYVKGYHRKDGTYVAPHYRSSPNSSRSDNYSSKGNYNPYTGAKGSQDPYRPPVRTPSYYPPTYSSPSSPAYERATPQPKPQVVNLWRCVAASGVVFYLEYPRAGCDVVAAVPIQPAQQSYTYGRPPAYFRGYRCSADCSGHEAGYEWAEENGIDDPSDCHGNSQSFIEGCQAYAEESE